MLETIYNKVKAEDLSVAEAIQEAALCKEDLIANVEKGDVVSAIFLLLGMVTHGVNISMGNIEDIEPVKCI